MIGPFMLFTVGFIFWTFMTGVSVMGFIKDLREKNWDKWWWPATVSFFLFFIGTESLFAIPAYVDFIFGTEWIDYLWNRM